MIDPDKEAFSTAPHDDEYGRLHGEESDMLHDADQHDGPSGSHYDGGESAYGGSYGGGGYVPPTVHDEPTGYAGAGHNEPTSYGGAGHDGPPEYGNAAAGRAQFPNARYDDV